MKREEHLTAEHCAEGLRGLAEDMEREVAELGMTHVEGLKFRARTALLRQSAQLLVTQRNQLMEVKK